MKRRVCGFAVVCALLVFSSVGLGNLVTANPIGYPIKSFPIVTINVNGTITPDADFLSRSGSTYTLTSNVSGYRINIECSDVIFDGNGHSMTLENNFMNPAIVAYQNYPTVVRNVTVKNVEVISPFTAIHLINCAYCRITNVTASADIELGMSSNNVISKNASPIFLNYGSEHNQIFGNNITGLSISYFPGQNIIYGNNILLDVDHPLYLASGNVWDNGSVGNYWSDYLTRYPNASEIGSTGVGDTPYVVDEDNADYHPLMYPYDIEKEAVALPTPEATPTPEPEPFPTTLVITASGASAAIIAIGLLMYLKKRNH